MKVLYAGLRNEAYNPKRRQSFEYQNFFLTFQAMQSITVIEHPFDRILAVGKQRYNEELLEIVDREKPDLLFAFMYTDEFDEGTLLHIKRETNTKSVAWFADDYWRFFNYSKHWPPYFTAIVTTYSKAVEWYHAAGFENVILSQWGCNTADFRPVDIAKDIDVSFVGQKKSGRVAVIEALQSAGVAVDCFGFGWPPSGQNSGGKLSHADMLKVFSRSKVCLNLTDRKSVWDPSIFARIFMKKSLNRVVPDFHLIDNFRAWRHFPIPHTHARPFELAGCGAFVLSGWSEDIGKYYEDGKEMVFYRSTDELIEKTKYYLAHDAEREAIARRGYERTMREHTYEARFKKIFAEIGLAKN